MEWTEIAAVCTGAGALLAGWASLKKAKSEGHEQGKQSCADVENELARCRAEIHALLEKLVR